VPKSQWLAADLAVRKMQSAANVLVKAETFPPENLSYLAEPMLMADLNAA
jgi:hypothetical protein